MTASMKSTVLLAPQYSGFWKAYFPYLVATKKNDKTDLLIQGVLVTKDNVDAAHEARQRPGGEDPELPVREAAGRHRRRPTSSRRAWRVPRLRGAARPRQLADARAASHASDASRPLSRSRGLTKRFPGVLALDDVSLDAAARRDPRADRAERRRQIDADQCALRHARAGCRRRSGVPASRSTISEHASRARRSASPPSTRSSACCRNLTVAREHRARPRAAPRRLPRPRGDARRRRDNGARAARPRHRSRDARVGGAVARRAADGRDRQGARASDPSVLDPRRADRAARRSARREQLFEVDRAAEGAGRRRSSMSRTASPRCSTSATERPCCATAVW